MSNQHPQSRRLRELLARIRQESAPEYEYEYDGTGQVNFNSHVLFQEACAKITAEQDVKIVREIALDYLTELCSVTPDHAATEILLRMDGIK